MYRFKRRVSRNRRAVPLHVHDQVSLQGKCASSSRSTHPLSLHELRHRVVARFSSIPNPRPTFASRLQARLARTPLVPANVKRKSLTGIPHAQASVVWTHTDKLNKALLMVGPLQVQVEDAPSQSFSSFQGSEYAVFRIGISVDTGEGASECNNIV